MRVPAEFRALEVTPGMFQTRQHYDAWKRGELLPTQRRARWRVPAKYEAFMWRHFGHKCQRCGATEGLTIGHLVPVQFGGSNEPSNIWPECWSCNRAQWTPECQRIARELRKEQAA